MKNERRILCLLIFLGVVGGVGGKAQSQMTVTFDTYPFNTHGWYFLENGMLFQVTAPPPRTPYVRMEWVGAGMTSRPDNGTPHIVFSGSADRPDSVVFNLTNGMSFGLVSVDLAEFYSPSWSSFTIGFNGYKSDGSMVSDVFNTAGNGFTNFETFYFSPAFASDLTRVEIPSQAWSMDNLVFTIPEPGTVTLWLVGLGSLGFLLRNRKRR